MGESKIFTNVVKKWARTPLSRAKNSKNKWAEWLGRGEGKGIRRPRIFVQVGGSNRDKRPALPFVPVGATNRDKRPPFCPGWCLQPGQKAPVPPLARLAVGPGTKATYCPGPKGCRDKWPGTKACFVVVFHDEAVMSTNLMFMTLSLRLALGVEESFVPIYNLS